MEQPGGEATRKALNEVWVFLGLTFLISWGVGAPWIFAPEAVSRLLGPFGPTSPFFFIAAWAPTIAAVTLTLIKEGWPGVGRLLRGLIRWRPAGLLVAAFIIIPLIALLLALLMPFIGPWPVPTATILVATPLVLFTTAQIVINTGPLGEELGWRGYALPRLLQKWGPAISGLIVGLVWTLWHVPAMLFAGIVGVSLPDLGWYALGTIGLSWLMTWLFVRTNGSILIAGVIPHFVINGLGKTGGWMSRPEETVALFVVGAVLRGVEAWIQKRKAA